MNFQLNYTKRFFRSLKRNLKKDHQLSKKVDKTLSFLEQDPFYNSLKTHQVESEHYGVCNSSWVTGDIRILWEYSATEIKVLDILDIGGHSGKNKVYK